MPAKALHVLFSLRDNDPDDKERSLLYAPSPLIGEQMPSMSSGFKNSSPAKCKRWRKSMTPSFSDYREDEID